MKTDKVTLFMEYIKNARETNIMFFLTLLFQIPGEEIEDVKVTYNYVRKLKELNTDIQVQRHIFSPLPNLPMTRFAIKKGYVPTNNMKGWVGIDHNLLVAFKRCPGWKNSLKRGVRNFIKNYSRKTMVWPKCIINDN